MVDQQAQEKIEELSTRNRQLLDENTKLRRANIALSALVASRNETVVMLEDEARAAKKKARRVR